MNYKAVFYGDIRHLSARGGDVFQDQITVFRHKRNQKIIFMNKNKTGDRDLSLADPRDRIAYGGFDKSLAADRGLHYHRTALDDISYYSCILAVFCTPDRF